MTEPTRRLEFYEIWVEGEKACRDRKFNREAADGLAQSIAEDELRTVEVRPIGPKGAS